MGGFFSMDGAFNRFGTILADIMILSVMWIVFSIPLFTIGASTSALYYVTTRRISDREGYIMRDFWTGFKAGFKKATLVWLILVAVVCILVLNILNIEVVGNIAWILLPIQVGFLIEIALVSVFLFPIASRFEMKISQIIKSSFYMANRHIFTSLTCLALALALGVAVYIYEILFFIVMGIYAWLTSHMIMRVFKKYRPEMDADPVDPLNPED